VNDANARIFFRVVVANFATFVGRTVVDENDFKIPKSLREQAVHAPREIFFGFVNGNDDGNFGLVFHKLAVANGFQLFEKVVAFVIDENERGEIFDFDFPNRFHAEFWKFDAFNRFDVILRENCRRSAD